MMRRKPRVGRNPGLPKCPAPRLVVTQGIVDALAMVDLAPCELAHAHRPPAGRINSLAAWTLQRQGCISIADNTAYITERGRDQLAWAVAQGWRPYITPSTHNAG